MIQVCVALFASSGGMPGEQFPPVKAAPASFSSVKPTHTPADAPASGFPAASSSRTLTRCVSACPVAPAASRRVAAAVARTAKRRRPGRISAWVRG